MRNEKTNALILCTGNSARSILAEALINQHGTGVGNGTVTGFSAGSAPVGKVNPFAIKLLENKGHSVTELRSTSWDEFAKPGAQKIHFVITVCDNAAGETCPVWPGHPMTAHWGIPDPATVEGTNEEKAEAFSLAYDRLEKRVLAFLSLLRKDLDAETLKTQLTAIGRTSD